jgi:phosphate starvation-inducible PhoH-like protein
MRVLDGVEGIKFCHFEDVDVVRHQLVQRIVRAYDSYKAAEQLPLAIDMPGERSEVAPLVTERPKRAVQTQ